MIERLTARHHGSKLQQYVGNILQSFTAGYINQPFLTFDSHS